MPVTRHLKRFTNSGAGKRPTVAPSSLLPTGVYRASTSRCCWCALTAPLHPYLFSVISYSVITVHCKRAVCFCGTILTLTRTGRYPASLVFREPGLSSDWSRPIRNHLANSLPISSMALSTGQHRGIAPTAEKLFILDLDRSRRGYRL